MRVMKEYLPNVFAAFVSLLTERFNRQTNTSEDDVRYAFFHALTGIGGIRPEWITLEAPHPAIDRAKLDTVVHVPDEDPLAVEFKYHRGGMSTLPRTQLAGQLIADFCRLMPLDDLGFLTLSVYVTDNQMGGYWLNPRNGLSDLFLMNEQDSIRLRAGDFEKRAMTFRRHIPENIDVKVTCMGRLDSERGDLYRGFRIER